MSKVKIEWLGRNLITSVQESQWIIHDCIEYLPSFLQLRLKILLASLVQLEDVPEAFWTSLHFVQDAGYTNSINMLAHLT